MTSDEYWALEEARYQYLQSEEYQREIGRAAKRSFSELSPKAQERLLALHEEAVRRVTLEGRVGSFTVELVKEDRDLASSDQFGVLIRPGKTEVWDPEVQAWVEEPAKTEVIVERGIIPYMGMVRS